MFVMKMCVRKMALIVLVCIFCTACASLVENAGRALDGSAFAEKSLALYHTESKKGVGAEFLRRNSDGLEFIGVSLDNMPGLRINISLPAEDGRFNLLWLDFFTSHLDGWNEFSMDAVGGGFFRRERDTAVVRFEGSAEAVAITGGKIRRRETRLSGEDALTALRAREERIRALAQWMKERGGAPEFSVWEDFEAYWKPFVLPELLPARERPANWNTASQMRRAEDIYWNMDYTRAVFPENLWEVRDSGTLLRDWEEAGRWLYFVYQWESLFGFLAGETHLVRIER
jgi:hypothetical protein